MAGEELKVQSDRWPFVSVHRKIPHVARRSLGRHAHFYLNFAMLASQVQVCLLRVPCCDRSLLATKATVLRKAETGAKQLT